MRFHLLDRIEALEKGHAIRAIKLTSRNEDYWDVEGTRLTMPRSLILEALCQAGSWLLLLSTEMKKRAALLSLGSVTYLGNVEPGATLEMEGTITTMNEASAVLSGRVIHTGRVILEARDIMCLLVDAERLEDPTVTARMHNLLIRGGGLPLKGV